ncbi:MAG: hypothetical protein U0Y08_11220 [Bacteroidia bacterium]
MRRKFFLMLCCIPVWSIAQTISPAGTNGGGGFLSASNGSLSYTIGQSFQQTLVSGGKVMTQGLQQPEINIKLLSVPTVVCNGDTVLIPYQALGFIDPANSFDLRLSDASGSFASPTTLASYTGTGSGSFGAIIPFNITPSLNYRMQIKSTSSTHNSKVSDPVRVNICSLRINLQAFIEGLYLGTGIQNNTLYQSGLSTNPDDADAIQVELHEATSPFNTVYSLNTILKTDGFATVIFPGSVYGNNYYVVIKHRNSIETWSKLPVMFSSPEVSYDFAF